MKHVKSFELYEGTDKGASFSINPKAKQAITNKFKALSDEKKEELKSELIQIAAKLKLKPEELTDSNKVAKAIIDSNVIKESEIVYNDESVSEGLGAIKNWMVNAKDKFFDYLGYAGLGSIVGGLITAGVGTEFMPNADLMSSSYIATPNTIIVAGGIAVALGLAAVLTSLAKEGALGSLGSASGSARR